MLSLLPLSLVILFTSDRTLASSANLTGRGYNTPSYGVSTLSSLIPPEKCPPCFNCLLPAFTCGQYGNCDPYNGQCKCPPGWGGIDCLIPQCDSLADGEHRRLREQGQSCQCKEGWGGINCNVCQNDNACVGFPLAGKISSLSDEPVEVGNMTCYKGGETVFNNHQMCDVTNRKILDMLPGRPPQVTFSCDSSDRTCSFQFWTAEVESFYCALEECSSESKPGYDTNSTIYACEKIKCSCVPGRFICGEDGSVDIGEFLKESIKGPASFSCKSGSGCKFEEPAMNELIDSIFGDQYITLTCQGGECLHYSQVPGYERPPKPDNTLWLALSAASAITIVLITSGILWYAGRIGGGDYGQIRLPDNEAAKLMTDHVPASLHFSNLTYTLGSRVILDNISGSVKPGQVMAIMGASGAGKSTFLDILARKRKRGLVSGTTLVNGREVPDSEFKAVMGFVDQEDTLMSTLTVYETVLYSALLRLPREMSYEAKKYRTLETMNELGILGIKDMRIGDSGRRSISGGEKRRVSIACELVTSPSILFLDEPTSGLDAFNAFNVVESLVSLARNYNRTVVFTIHQPRSNIVALFDQLVLLAMGKLVYSGELSKCQDYFASIAQPCPPGFNIADFLIDLTMHASMDAGDASGAASLLEGTTPLSDDTTNIGDEERGLGNSPQALPLCVRSRPTSSSTVNPDNDETELQTRPNSIASSTGRYIKHKTSQLFEAVTSSGSGSAKPISPKLAALVDAYATSDIAKEIREESEALRRQTAQADSGVRGTGVGELPDVALETTLLRGRKRASWGTQFRILSGRAFKNLYRDPALLAAHYTSSIVLALICGLFFHNVTNDIAGFQNRLGIFFFTLALFGFSCLSSLGLFANERILFMRERANGYYSSFTYFSSKIMFDILPLRLVPPLMFGGIVYGLVGLVPTVPAFWKFMLTLVLFNLTTASVVLLLSIACASISVASLVGTLIMLFNLLFTGLLINRDSVTPAFRWLHTISFFHAAFEALAVNELRYLQLKEVKYGVELDVPAATILSVFGLRAQSFWWPNISLLGIFFVVFTAASFVTLHLFVKEKR
ncbi:putative ABC-2 type transporter [Lyophyllum shimeji]|uniref:ABC-2 type transporter n=1 Tax=Lyophyllum shimeji TaxID=47721 RepID=A0A9P3PRJ5_LYOSH|nr:putative ABC-2 type transporter [Lyophyllum shimeji]